MYALTITMFRTHAHTLYIRRGSCKKRSRTTRKKGNMTNVVHECSFTRLGSLVSSNCEMIEYGFFTNVYSRLGILVPKKKVYQNMLVSIMQYASVIILIVLELCRWYPDVLTRQKCRVCFHQMCQWMCHVVGTCVCLDEKKKETAKRSTCMQKRLEAVSWLCD